MIVQAGFTPPGHFLQLRYDSPTLSAMNYSKFVSVPRDVESIIKLGERID